MPPVEVPVRPVTRAGLALRVGAAVLGIGLLLLFAPGPIATIMVPMLWACLYPLAAATAIAEVVDQPSPGEVVPSVFDERVVVAVAQAVSAAARAEGERRRRQWAANYKRRFDEAGVDFMLVLTLGDKPALRANQSYGVRRNNQLANSLSFPMVSFPIGYADGLPINADFKGPRFSEPVLTQAMIDYQARYPEHNRARPADPAPRSSVQRLSGRQAAAADDDPTLSNDPLVHEVHVG
jgi:hypothetical protein